MIDRKLVNHGENRLAIFRRHNQWFAIDNHCPHRGGPIAAGDWDGQCLTCPWHGMQFDIETGRPLNSNMRNLTVLPVRIRDGIVQVDLDASEAGPVADGIHRFVVRYGIGGDIGVFGSVHKVDCRRGDQIVVQSNRGIEVGVVLRPGDDRAIARRRPTGEVLRLCSQDDRNRAEAAIDAARNQMPFVQQKLTEAKISAQIVDAETTLDGGQTIYYYLGKGSTNLGPLALSLSQHETHQVRFQEITLE